MTRPDFNTPWFRCFDMFYNSPQTQTHPLLER